MNYMSRKQDPEAVTALLQDYGDKGGLRKIVRQAHRLLALDPLLKQCLPENLRPHCQIAQFATTKLTLLIDSAAWLTYLRPFIPQLLTRLKQHPQFAYLSDIQTRIQPAYIIPPPIEKKPVAAQLSEENKQLLQSIAETISNPSLKKALIKLSS